MTAFCHQRCSLTGSSDEIYFHAHSVPNHGFRTLKVGSKVRYHAETGETACRPPLSSRSASPICISSGQKSQMVHQPVVACVSQLSHDDVTHLIGDVEESVIASILATGATYPEIEQALK